MTSAEEGVLVGFFTRGFGWLGCEFGDRVTRVGCIFAYYSLVVGSDDIYALYRGAFCVCVRDCVMSKHVFMIRAGVRLGIRVGIISFGLKIFVRENLYTSWESEIFNVKYLSFY